MSAKDVVSFKWDEKKHEDFVTWLRRKQAEGEIDPDANKSEVIRQSLEEKMKDDC